MSLETNHEEWQVESGDRIFSTNIDEMSDWIRDGSMLRIDRVRRGNLRWIEAGKVPTLAAIFDEKDKASQNIIVTTTTAAPHFEAHAQASDFAACSVHTEVPARFECDTCSNKFCKTCPNSYGGNVKICPFCGAMCRPVEASTKAAAPRSYSPRTPFGFGDFTAALAYPFRFPVALIIGGGMFTLLCIGRSGSSFGGMFMMWGAIACYLLSNTLTFGILANTVENFSQGRLEENFMPTFDNFSIWEDAVHPFFLMLGVNLVSFLPLAAVAIFAFYSIFAAVGESAPTIAAAAPQRFEQPTTTVGNTNTAVLLAEIAKAQAEQQKARVEAIENGNLAPANALEDDLSEEDAVFERLSAEADRNQAVLASAQPEAADSDPTILNQLARSGVIVLLGLIVSLAWAAFFFPAACAVAGYTRSLGAVLNVTVGLDTIRRLGVSYAKIVAIFVVIWAITGAATLILNIVFAPLDLPMVGNIPATAIVSFISFYLSIVFSVVLGLALYKRAEQLELPQA